VTTYLTVSYVIVDGMWAAAAARLKTLCPEAMHLQFMNLGAYVSWQILGEGFELILREE